jgi:hypothetical protein
MVLCENQYFLPSCANFVSSSVLLPSFNDVSTIVDRFKPRIVYQRHHPLPLSTPEPTSDHVLQEPRWSTRVLQPPNRYGFSHSAVQATIDIIYMPKSYSQASTRVLTIDYARRTSSSSR